MLNLERIGANIAQLRKEKGMTQLELAEKLFVSHQAVSNWERGETMPDIAKLPVLAEILNVGIENILGEAEPIAAKNMSVDNGECAIASQLDMVQIVQMAPYISNDILEQISNTFYEKEGIESLVPLAPFLKESMIDAFAQKTFNVHGVNPLVPIWPFISQETSRAIVTESINRHGISSIIGVMPLIDKNILDSYMRGQAEVR